MIADFSEATVACVCTSASNKEATPAMMQVFIIKAMAKAASFDEIWVFIASLLAVWCIDGHKE
jgi:hypothetical protein